ncbi:DUF1631 domain-containing protein [Pseudomonas sp. WJP1]|uniref:DUF1631 family protein n=1 Tax=Pseudomonas sp. WJP1 TaxID=2986947 RepID=UPI00234A93EE|nr:DUF1631 family protein [Pseudomonas sp. WJP1]WCM52117.1 DUF1631 domain-containing protein [Pseudomonas sp. WJP1]
MHNDGNVVPLRRVASDQATQPPLARLPVIVLQVRDKATQQLRQGLQALFDNADGTLFEMADQALDDAEQNLFFEAMRDLRLKRKSIERLFFEQLFKAFINLGQCDLAYRVLPRSLSANASAAPRDDGPERNLAVQAMVNKTLYRDGFALDQLTARLSTLLGRTLIEQHNPLGPTVLCKCFLAAARHLGVDIEVKLIILQLFDRYVLSGAGQLYAQANQLLIATGVLPGLAPPPTSDTMDNKAAGALPPDERRRSELLEQRIRDAEEECAQTSVARQQVEQALNQALLGKRLPHSVLAFVHEAWSNVLLLTCLKHGHLSMQWQADVQTMEQLIWSVRRHDSPDAREHLLTMVPGLLKSLREGLGSSAFDPFATRAFFSELERLHVQLLEHPGHPPASATMVVEVLEPFLLSAAEDGPCDTARLPDVQRLNRVK